MNSRRLFTLAAVSAMALVPAAQGAQQRPAHPQTTAPPPVVDIKVTITDTGIVMSPKRAFRGDYARFILHNRGKQPHTVAFGQGKRGTGVQTGFSKSVKPSQVTVLLLFLDYRGRVSYRGTLPADRSKPGMTGVFTIN